MDKECTVYLVYTEGVAYISLFAIGHMSCDVSRLKLCMMMCTVPNSVTNLSVIRFDQQLSLDCAIFPECIAQ